MILPTRRFLYLMLAEGGCALLPLFFGESAVLVWLLSVALLILLFLVDLALSVPKNDLHISSSVPAEVYMGDSFDLSLVANSVGRLPRRLQMLVEAPATATMTPFAACLREGEAAEIRCDMTVSPLRRGLLLFDRIDLSWTGPMGLCERRKTDSLGTEVAVVPNLRAVRESALTFANRAEVLSGLKADRILGEGSEFDRMREFVPGMDLRSIDWKASARHRRLMARQYRAERNHQVILSIDTGRLMAEPLEGIPRIDHAISASLLLAWSCLKTGDRVALHAFADRSYKYVEAEGGVRSLPRIRSATAELEYRNAETNFTLGLTQLSLKLRRRALIVVFTDFSDSITAEIMMDNIQVLARRHLIIFISLRDPFLDQASTAEPTSAEQIGRTVVVNELLRERSTVLKRLERAGVRVLDVLPSQLSAALLQSYLDVKKRELL